MTGDVNERTSLSSYRFVSAMIAQLIVGGFTLPLVAKFGQGDSAKGWQMTGIGRAALYARYGLTAADLGDVDPMREIIYISGTLG